jgi:replicative DNA helicase
MTSLNKLTQYGLSFQSKIISLLLTRKEFLINIIDSLNSDYFENISQKWIVDYIIKYFGEYHTYPSMEVLSIEVKKLENEILRIAVTDSLRESYNESNAKDLDWVQKEFTNFCTNQQVKNAIVTSVNLLEIGDYEGIRRLINQALKAGEEKNTGHDYNKDVESRYREDDRNPIAFPWEVFNNLTQGGAGKGDLVLFFGNPGGGKTWACIAYAAYAAACGYNVVYYTLELSEAYVGRRFDAVLTGIPVDQLPNNRNSVEEVVKKLKGHLKIKEYPPRRASSETINAHLDQLKHLEDFDAELVVIDYIDYMRTRPRKDKKEEIDDAYVEVKAMAKDREIPIISPSQANRSGANSEILEGNNAAGSYDKIMIGDILFSVARGRKNKLNGTGLWHIMKNRYGPDGLTFSSKFNASNGHIVINDKPLDDETIDMGNKKKQEGTSSEFNDDDRDLLKQKFFNMQVSS